MSKDLKTFSLEELTSKIKEISGKWHKGVAKGDQGAGRTLEKLLGVGRITFPYLIMAL